MASGTKLHQAMHAAIKKHALALMAGLWKYNDTCAMLSMMYKHEWNIPLPEPLPTELKPLCDAPNLMENVWITCLTKEVPHWLGDSAMREGIQAILKVDCCAEELQWLQVKVVNLSQWFGHELAAIQLALLEPTNGHLHATLEQ
ncbi:hypothetical protein C0995_007402 [Termitomyces sp. Mi166|nr:hypothetical protein C0995_007402 [Termitomyces sp. Mi166\